MFGEIDTMDLTPIVAGDRIVYEMVVPIAPALLGDVAALVARETAAHAAVERAAPWLVGALALRYVAAEPAP